MLGITVRSNADYYLSHSCDRGEVLLGQGGPAGYELDAVAAGEPAGVWDHRGENRLGVEGTIVPGRASGEAFRTLVNELRDPTTGEALGSRPRRFKTPEQRVAEFRRKNPHATPEQIADCRVRSEKDQREATHALDLTFSPPKSWSVLHAALERAGRHDEAELVWAALRAGIDAAVTQAVDEHAFTRQGVAGPKVAGRVTTQYVATPDVTLAVFRHHTSRERDPQLHAHVMMLARVQTADGRWRALWPTDLMRSKHQLDATFLRVAEVTLARSMPEVRFATRPDGKAREITGVTEQVRDLFSSRSRALTEDAQQLVDAFTARYGRAPTALQRWQMLQHATLESRRAKPAQAPSREEDLDRWERATAQKVRGGLASVIDGVELAAEDPAPETGFEPATVIDQAVADLEASKSTFSRSHLYHAISNRLPDMLAIEPARVPELLTQLTEQAVATRQVVAVSAPPVARVPRSLQDPATGRSIFEVPNATRFTTARHLAREDSIVARLEHRGATPVERDVAVAALDGFDLGPDQLEVGTAILTSDRRVEIVVAPAGAGKSRLTAALSEASARLTGHGLVGFTTSQVGAEVMAAEGVERTHNLRAFLTFHERPAAGEASEVEQLSFAVPAGGTVVFDEASMISTPDLAATMDILDDLGVGRVILIGDTEQLDAPGAGGAFAMLAGERDPHELSTVRRFRAQWEREASTRLRDGDATALTQYDARARVHGYADLDEARDAAVTGFVVDHLEDRDTVVVTGTEEEASDLSSRIRVRLAEAGHVHRDGVELRDRNAAGVGDLIATRRNDRALTGGPVFNREVWQVVGTDDTGELQVRRAHGRDEHGERTWGAIRTLPAPYVAEHVELAYAGTTHAVEGRTTDTSHDLDPQDRAHAYVGMTRGREANHAYLPLGLDRGRIEQARRHVAELEARAETASPAAQDKVAVDLARARADLERAETPEHTAVGRLANVIETDRREQAARVAIAAEQDRADHLGHLGPQWQMLVTEDRSAAHRDLAREVLGADAERVLGDPSSASVLRLMRAAESAGHDPAELLGRAHARGSLDGARSPGRVLFARLDDELTAAPARGDRRVAFTYTDRTPAGDDERMVYAREVAAAMDARTTEAGARAAEAPQRWAVERLGEPPADPGERLGWSGRAGVVAAYREQFGWDDERDPLGPRPTRHEPERQWAWDRGAGALGMDPRERDMAGLSDGELANREQQWEREQAWMPRNVDEDLRETYVAHDEARRQVVEARARGEETLERETDEVVMAERLAQLEEVAEVRAAAVEATRGAREAAEEARAERARRRDVERARAGEPAEVEVAEVEAGDVEVDDRPEPAPERSPEREVDERAARDRRMREDLERARAAAQVLADRQAAQQRVDDEPVIEEPEPQRELVDD